MRKRQFAAIASALSLSLALGLGASGFSQTAQAATEHWNDASTDSSAWSAWKTNWDSYSSNYENVSLTPGAEESSLNFAWYSHTEETPKVRIAKSEDMSDAKEYTGTQEQAVTIDETQYYSNKASVDGLEENTTYYYQVYKNGAWSDAETYATQSFSSFSFLYVGDPQIGASKNQTSTENETMSNAGNTVTSSADENLAARNDSYNWNKILSKAYEEHSDVSFIASAGDQVNYAKNEREYAGYLGADVLKSLPVATTIGNHDSASYQYTYHYNNPNAFSLADSSLAAYTEGHTAAGSDYYYTYGDALFIVLDTNNYNCATHENVIKKAVSENSDAIWRIVMFHQDIYGSGADHSDSDGMVLRTQLTPLMDTYDIDVVLQGHDHTYSRTYQLSGDGEDHAKYSSDGSVDGTTAYRGASDYQDENAGCYIINSDTKSGTVVNPEGTVYMEANSSTGSKFYNLIATQQDYISERSQTWTPSYSVVNVDARSFSITTYDGTTGQELNGSSTYTIIKDDVTQKITGTSSYTKQVGDKPFKLDVTAEGTLSYTSDNEDVAVVSNTGKVSIVGEGTAKITVKAAATEKKEAAEMTVTVTVKAADGTEKPKQAVLTRAFSKKKSQVKVKWQADPEADGYEVVCASNKTFTRNVSTFTIKKNTKTTKTIKKLAGRKKIFVKIRSYKTVNGQKVYGDYSNVKKVKVK